MTELFGNLQWVCLVLDIEMATEDISAAEKEDEIPEYLREVHDVKFLNISIKGYEKKTVSSGFSKEEFYAYRIVSILTGIDGASSDEPAKDDPNRKRDEVWRRYSEFEALRHFLCAVYPHIIVPPLPEKAIKGSSGLLNKITFTGEDTDFLLRRQQALELFIVRISRHPILSRNYWFHQFMQLIGWKEAALETGYATKAETLFQYFSHSLSKLKPDQHFQDAKEYANELERIFRSLLEVRNKMNSSMKAVYKIHSNYGRIFSEWSEIEDILGTPLQITGGCMDSYADSYDVYVEEEEVRYLLPLKEYIAYCDSLRTVVRRQEMLQKQVEKCEDILSAKSDAKEALVKENPDTGGSKGSKFSFKVLTTRLKGGDTSYFGRMTQATRELQEAEDHAKKSQTDLETFTDEGISELERFNDQKTSDFKSILINYVQLQMHVHRKGINTWERVKEGFDVMYS